MCVKYYAEKRNVHNAQLKRVRIAEKALLYISYSRVKYWNWSFLILRMMMMIIIMIVIPLSIIYLWTWLH